MHAQTDDLTRPPAPVGFWEAFRFWLTLGFVSFGGPAGQIAVGAALALIRYRQSVIHVIVTRALRGLAVQGFVPAGLVTLQ